MSDRGMNAVKERDQSPVDDAFLQLSEGIDGIGQAIARLENRLHDITNNHPRPGREEMKMDSKPSPSGDSPMLSKIRVLSTDLDIQRDRILVLLDQLDI